MPNPSYLALGSMQGQILCSQQLPASTDTTVYTVPANTTVKVTHGVVCNISSTLTATLLLSLIPSGGSADGTHRIVSNYPLAPGDSLSLAPYLAGAMLGPGDSIHAQASVSGSVNIVITGAVSA